MGDDRFYGSSGNSPFVAVFCGTDGYKGLMSGVNEPGTDGTVRLSGAALNTRKFELDLRASVELGKRERLRVAEWSNSDIPVVAIEGVDHSSIMVAPTQELKQFVRGALGVRTKAEHEVWLESVRAHNQKVTASQGRSWQQLIVRVVDGHDQPVEAYFIDFHFKKGTEWVSALSQDVPVSVHAYSTDNSFRCFHVDLGKLLPLGEEWALTVRVVTGTRFTRAVGWIDRGLKTLATDLNACAAVRIASRGGVEFFFPNTTTLIEIRIDQEPTEDDDGVRLVDFTDRRERVEAEEAKGREVARAANEKAAAERTARLDELEAGFVRDEGSFKS